MTECTRNSLLRHASIVSVRFLVVASRLSNAAHSLMKNWAAANEPGSPTSEYSCPSFAIALLESSSMRTIGAVAQYRRELRNLPTGVGRRCKFRAAAIRIGTRIAPWVRASTPLSSALFAPNQSASVTDVQRDNLLRPLRMRGLMTRQWSLGRGDEVLSADVHHLFELPDTDVMPPHVHRLVIDTGGSQQFVRAAVCPDTCTQSEAEC